MEIMRQVRPDPCREANGMQITERLRKSEEFARVYQTGRAKSDGRFVLYASENADGRTRLGVSVSKKVGNSVVRHRIKRLVKEAWRVSETQFRAGFDYVVVARGAAAQADFHDTDRSLRKLAERLRVSAAGGGKPEDPGSAAGVRNDGAECGPQ